MALTVLLVVLAWSLLSCTSKAATTTSSAVPATTTLAPTTTITSTSQSPIWSYTPTSTPPTLAGLTPFPMLLDHYGRLLDGLQVPSALPYAVLGANQLATIFKDSVPDTVTGAQGFQMANGDVVVLFATRGGPPWDHVIKSFTDTYGGEGRTVTERLNDGWGYLVASKGYADDFATLADIAYDVQDLEGALATAHDLFRAAGPPASTATSDQEGTAQAEAALVAFFRAWGAKDLAAYKALLSERRLQDMKLGDWTFAGLDRMEFGPLIPAPEVIDPWIAAYGHPYMGDIAKEDVRCFRASVAWYNKPGVEGPTVNGEELPWMWFMVREADGNWRVDDWGA